MNVSESSAENEGLRRASCVEGGKGSVGWRMDTRLADDADDGDGDDDAEVKRESFEKERKENAERVESKLADANGTCSDRGILPDEREAKIEEDILDINSCGLCVRCVCGV